MIKWASLPDGLKVLPSPEKLDPRRLARQQARLHSLGAAARLVPGYHHSQNYLCDAASLQEVQFQGRVHRRLNRTILPTSLSRSTLPARLRRTTRGACWRRMRLLSKGADVPNYHRPCAALHVAAAWVRTCLRNGDEIAAEHRFVCGNGCCECTCPCEML
jgi:hypothetical protein